MRSWWVGLLQRVRLPARPAEAREAALERTLSYQFQRPALLALALTHPSAAGPGGPHYERLEFLGDAVLDLAIADLLMRRMPEAKEGVLSKERASIVNGRTLALKALEIGLAPRIRLGKGEEKSGGRNKTSILAASFEAVVGAIYSDGGLAAASVVIEALFADEIGGPAAQRDYKTELQEVAYRWFQAPPIYELLSAHGPEHAKRFVTRLTVAGREMGSGEGSSKKASEQAAARMALHQLAHDRNGDGSNGEES
jgi:ribonuclease III